MRTRVCEMLGIEFPILAFSHCRDVVAEVTKAGGFGVLGAVAHTPEQLEIDLTWIEEQVAGKPYGVDLLLPSKFAGASEGGFTSEQIVQLLPPEHQEFVEDILKRYEVPEMTGDMEMTGGMPRGLNVSPLSYGPLIEVVFAHDIKLIASALGAPPPDLVERAHSQGVLVAALAGTKAHAVRHVAAGVDLIIAQGTEAGGHTGEVATMVLVPEVVDAVAPVPVLAAGGIGRGRQMAASIALGAEGVWTGSVWLTTDEAETHPVVKQKYLAAGSSDTIRSRSITGKPARMLKSAWTEEWAREDTPEPLMMPLQTALVGEALLRVQRAAFREGSGAEKLVNYFVGQVVGTMDRIKPARQVVLDMIDEYIDAAQHVADVMGE